MSLKGRRSKVFWSNVFSNFQEEINCFRQIECFFSAALFHDGRWRSWKVMGGEGDHEYLHLSHTSSFHRRKEKTLKMYLKTMEQWNRVQRRLIASTSSRKNQDSGLQLVSSFLEQLFSKISWVWSMDIYSPCTCAGSDQGRSYWNFLGGTSHL